MSDTYEVTIDNAGWTDISQGNDAGFMTVFGDKDILYRQGDTQPATSELQGHRLSAASDFVNFTVIAPERVYGRANSPQSLVVVTIKG